MKSIYKYPVKIKEKQEIELPVGAEIIRVEDVDGEFFLWALVNNDPESPKEIRKLEYYKTGQNIEKPDGLNYLGFCRLFVGQELCLYMFERV